ncbi:phosphatases II [Russula compacta]|nr:phosphatases II [Russula compacta]
MPFRNVSVIIEGRLFLGNLVSAQSTRSLTERRITHIVSVCTEPIPADHPQSGIVHMRIPVHDAPYENLLIHMPRACHFIDEALRSGGVVLVHGVHGLSRGATIMAAYYVSVPPKPWTQLDEVRLCSHLSPLTGFNLASGIGREQIWINAGFHEQLLLFELCRYLPSEQEGIYVRWRQNLQRHLQGRG